MPNQLSEARINTLTAAVFRMSTFALRVALVLILTGEQPDEAIIEALHPTPAE